MISVILSKRSFWIIKGFLIFFAVAFIVLGAYTYALKKTIDVQLIQAYDLGRKTHPGARYEDDNQTYCWDGGNYFYAKYAGKNTFRVIVEPK